MLGTAIICMENFALTTTAGIQPDINCWRGLIVHVDKRDFSFWRTFRVFYYERA